MTERQIKLFGDHSFRGPWGHKIGEKTFFSTCQKKGIEVNL